MAKFNYVARDKKGERITGELEVEDRQAVVARLQTMGFFPVKIEDVTPKRRGGMSLSAMRGKVSTAQMVNFNRQLADLVGAGVQMARALSIILNQTHDPMLRDVVSDINKNVQGGDTLARAMQRHPAIFNTMSVAMVRAGETGGMLPDVLQRLADFSEKEEELKGKVLSSLAYPSIMVFAGTVVIIILLTVVIPKITTVYDNLNQTLPLITQILITITDSLAASWWIAIPAIIVAVAGVVMFLKTPDGRGMYDRAILKVPVIGGIIHGRELSRFCRTLGNLLRNGVPILTALDITKEVLTNTLIRMQIDKLAPAISQGDSMAETMGESDVFPETVVSMVAVGEETAQVDEILLKVADSFENRVDRALKTMTSMLEPLIILAMGLVVGFIVIAMMLPIMSLDPTGGEL